MKKSLLVAAMAVLGFTTVNAQDDGVTSSQFGAKAGFNSLSIRASADGASASESVSGFYLGVFGEFEVSEKFNIQPELQFISVSEDGENSSLLALPIMVKFKAAEKLSILAGPQLDLLLDEEAEGIKKFGVGLGAGLAYDITEKFIIDARYVLGLSNRLEDNDFGGVEVNTTFNYVQFGLGYKF
ncbi:porin family protein [Pontimicrobium sp. SW4]|uniref:Porin family protein n=1 Tax=Pontimicrobium sp. SW4 TaxID=3153519 RepID=A0AAU7BXY7_9FLAO